MKQLHKFQPSNNNRHLISLFSFLLLLFLFTSSCQDEEIYLIDSPDSSFNIENAKNWFEANNSPIMEFNPTEPINANNKFDAKTKNKKQILLQNDWKHAFKTKRGNLEVVEVTLKSKGFFGFAGSSSTEKWKQTNNYGYLRSISRLIIIKNKKDNSIKNYIMTIMGSTNYLEKNNFKYGSNTYLKKEKDFDGMVFFNTLEGDFINGWEIKKGKTTGKLTKKTALSKNYALKGEYVEECYYEVITNYYYQETNWYTMAESANGEIIYVSFTETTWEYTEETGEPYEVCEDVWVDSDPDVDPDPDPDGGGGGGLFIDNLEIKTFEQDYRNKMSSDELILFDSLSRQDQLKYLWSAKQAIDKSKELFNSLLQLYNGKGDAFRHAYWNALSTQRLGSNLTGLLTSKHENIASTYPYQHFEKTMDLFNNSIGRNIGENGSGDLVQDILDALDNGDLRYLSNQDSISGKATYNSEVIPTDQ